jgi:hypothetical protein
MYYYVPEGKGMGWTADTREAWVTRVTQTDHHLKPPSSWIAAQQLKDRAFMAAVSIWAKYPQERKVSIWLMSSDEDFAAAGYLRGPGSGSPFA